MVGFVVPENQPNDAPPSPNSVSLRPAEDARVKAKGFKGLAHLLRVYFHMLRVVTFLAIWLTTLYGVFSYVWPHVFCREQIETGLTKGLWETFTNCMANKNADYSHNPGYKYWWLVFRSIIWAWFSFFPLLICRAMLGPYFSRAELLLSFGSVAMMFTSAMVIGRSGVWGDLFTYNMYFIAAPMIFLSLLISANIIRRYTNDSVNMIRWIFLFVAAVLGNALYFIFMPRMITQNIVNHPFQLLLTRLVIHPIIWVFLIQLFILFGRHMDSTADANHLVHIPHGLPRVFRTLPFDSTVRSRRCWLAERLAGFDKCHWAFKRTVCGICAFEAHVQPPYR
eukprot:jgi/Botrbrau1/3784/Bobra.0183s0018.2